MSKLVWKDETTYSRFDTQRVPTSFSLSVGVIEVYITSQHIFNPGNWVMHCKQLGLDTFAIGIKADVSVDYAKDCALQVIKDLLEQRIVSYQETLNALAL